MRVFALRCASRDAEEIPKFRLNYPIDPAKSTSNSKLSQYKHVSSLIPIIIVYLVPGLFSIFLDILFPAQ